MNITPYNNGFLKPITTNATYQPTNKNSFMTTTNNISYPTNKNSFMNNTFSQPSNNNSFMTTTNNVPYPTNTVNLQPVNPEKIADNFIYEYYKKVSDITVNVENRDIKDIIEDILGNI